MFEGLGRKIDDLIYKVGQRLRKTRTYKLYGYYFTKKKIKNKEFKSDKHFNKFMSMGKKFNYFNEKQIKKLTELYERDNNG